MPKQLRLLEENEWAETVWSALPVEARRRAIELAADLALRSAQEVDDEPAEDPGDAHSA